jgi:hypothetical protein
MISAIVLLGAFNGYYIPDILYHTDHFLLPHGIGADRTDICIGHIIATLAEADLRSHTGNHLTEFCDINIVLLQQMQDQSQSCFLANTGKFGKFTDCIFKLR